MARATSEINIIAGKVIVKETSVGVPGVIVTAYDIDLETNREENFTNIAVEPGSDFWNKFKNADRLGSIITDDNGLFSLVYDDSAFRSNNGEKRPDLLLIITTPEQQGAEPCPTILHLSCNLRRNAGRIENYVIWIPSEVLARAGIKVIDRSARAVEEEPIEIIKKMEDTYSREREIEEGTRGIVAKRIARKREIENTVKEKVQEFVINVSNPPSASSNDYAGKYVKAGKTAEDVTRQVIKDAISKIINNTSFVKHVSVAQDQLAALQDASGNFKIDIPAEEVAHILSRPKNQQSDQILLRIDPLNMCRPQNFPYKKCVTKSGNGNGDNEPIENNEILTKEDLPRHTNKLIESISPPEKPVLFDGNGSGRVDGPANSRAGEKDVQKTIDEFGLHHGPADVASIYDFHHLQISFEHVWNQLLDDRILNCGNTLYSKWAQMGLDIGDVPLDGGLWSPEHANNTLGVLDEPDAQVVEFFSISQPQWLVLNESLRNKLKDLAARMKDNTSFIENANLLSEPKLDWKLGIGYYDEYLKNDGETVGLADSLKLRDAYIDHLRDLLKSNRKRGESIIRYADKLLKAGQSPLTQINNLIGELDKLLNENYLFTVYAADASGCSINYGLDVVYRQEWQPVNYQVGKLIKTIPLAPKETRKFSKKIVIKKSKSVKEVEDNLNSKKSESSDTYKAETEIVLNSTNKTNFNLTTQGNFTVGVDSGSVTAVFGKDTSTTSNEVKKDFHEAVLKSSQEYTNKHNIEINSSESIEEQFEESGEISNPNDEIPVTYLFYELQRRYSVREQIHKVVPIILVAQQVPKPNEIDNDWIVRHDWILNRVLLDDSFRPALSYLSTKITGDEYALKQMAENLEQQRKLVEDIKEELVTVREQVGRRYAALEESIKSRADSAIGEESGNLVERAHEALFGFSAGGIVDSLFGAGKNDAAVEAARMREEAAKDAYERVAREEKNLQDKLQREVTALNAATESYTKAASEHLNTMAQISRLRLHIKENILYYMQAIWNHEPPDQRFFRLHKVKVPKLSGKIIYSTIKEDPTFVPLYPHWDRVPLEVHVNCVLDQLETADQFQTLAEVADLDNLLGYKGNYMIFPLKQSNALTDFMMEPYRDPHTVIKDPDESGNWRLDQFEEYVCCLKNNLNHQNFNQLKQGIEKKYDSLVNSSAVQDEEIIIPSGSLFIENLPGKHPILEDFKLIHRAIDVKKVQAEVRKAELENIRLAARLVTEEYEDADIEKKIVIEGDTEGTIVTPEDS